MKKKVRFPKFTNAIHYPINDDDPKRAIQSLISKFDFPKDTRFEYIYIPKGWGNFYAEVTARKGEQYVKKKI